MRIASLPLPPGPRSRTISGTRDEARSDVLGFYTRLARRYPRIASIRAYWIRLVLVTDPALIQHLLRLGPQDVVGARSRRALRVALGDGLLTAEGEVWRRERALVQPAFRHDRLRSYAPMIVRRTVAARERLRDGAPIDLHQLATSLTLGIIAEALFGAELSGRVTEVGDGLAHVMNRFEEVFIRSRLPIPLRLPTPRNLRLRRAIQRLHDVVDDIVDRRMAVADRGEDLLSDLIAATRRDGTTEARQRLRDEVLTLLLAGHETTALVVTFALLLLSRHPDEDRAIADELDAALDQSEPDAHSLARLPRLRRVVQETMRLYPPAWALGRQATRDLELGGYRIPRGAQIFAMPWVTHRDPRWFRDPDRFWPDRWSADQNESTEPPPVTREAYFPFGAGPRACVGAGLAMLEAPLVLAALLSRWRFDVPASFEPELQAAITLRPRTGVPAIARSRSSQGA